MSTEILLERHGAIALLTLNRPERLNALSDSMMDRWTELLRELNGDPSVRVVVVTGAGRGFCSGGDMKNRWHAGTVRRGPAEIRDHLELTVHPLAMAAAALRKPYIAAVNGPAVGAGMDLASMTDIRFAAASATFCSGYINVGLIPADGGAYWLPRLIGLPRALELILSGRTIGAEEARDLGYVSQVWPDTELLERTLEYAEQIAAKGALQLQVAKQLTVASQSVGLPESLQMARFAMSLIEGRGGRHDLGVDSP